MSAIDIGPTSSAVVRYQSEVVERAPSSISMLEDWGKKASSNRSSKHATQHSLPNRCYVLLVDGRPVFVLTEDRPAAMASKDEPTAQPVVLAQRLDWIKDRLALSITQMAELFGVTRKTVYDWYEGKGQRSATTVRMEILIDVLSLAPPDMDLHRLKAVWGIAVSGKSFRDIFGDDKLNAAALRAALNEKLNGLSPRMVATPRFSQKPDTQFGEAQLAELDRRTDFD